jgi:hypothetical protein
MVDREPKDFHLGRRAYEAYYNEQPQVWFDDLNHEAQMRWVRAARAVIEDLKVYKRHTPHKYTSAGQGSVSDDSASDEAFLATMPHRPGGQLDWTKMTEAQKKQAKTAKDRIYYKLSHRHKKGT